MIGNLVRNNLSPQVGQPPYIDVCLSCLFYHEFVLVSVGNTTSSCTNIVIFIVFFDKKQNKNGIELLFFKADNLSAPHSVDSFLNYFLINVSSVFSSTCLLLINEALDEHFPDYNLCDR